MKSTVTDHRTSILQLIEEARQLSEPEQVAALEEAVALADAHQDVEMGYDVRLELMNASLNCGKADTLLVAFSWCAGMAERFPDQFDTQRVLWWNRWAVIYAPTFPSIAAERIHAAVEDMEQRYRKAGASLRTVHWATWKVAFEMGERRTAARAFRAMTRAQSDWLGPDPDTEEVMHLEYWAAFAQHKKVAELAAAILRRGRANYYEQQIRSWLLVALLHLGQWEEAMKHHHLGYRKMIRQPSVVIQASRHLTLLAVTMNFQRAFRLFERYIGYCVQSDPQDQFELFNAVELTLRCALKSGKEKVRLRLPATAPGYSADGQYPTDALADVYRQATLLHASSFDHRNSNDHYTRIHARLQKLVRKAKVFPLPS
jgi:hypothetical protein